MSDNEITFTPVSGQRSDAPDPDIFATRAREAEAYLARQRASQVPTVAAAVRELGPARRQLGAAEGLRVVGLRVDGLTLAAAVELDTDRLAAWRFAHLAELPEEGGIAPTQEPGTVRVYLDGWGGGLAHVDLAVRPLRGDRWFFENRDLRGLLDLHPLSGCELEVTFTADFLATNVLDTCEAYMRAIAARVGHLAKMRIRKLDIAADIAGWTFDISDRLRLVKPGRSPVTSYVELPDAAGVKMHGGERITGFTVGAGGPVLLRGYDKRWELEVKSQHKKAMEEAIWRANGWDGQAPVARLEFQLRGEALRSFGVESPDRLTEALDPIWQYLVRHWCRMVLPGRSRLSRGAVDPRWRLLQSSRFGHESLPAARHYVRGGATLAQSLGALLSYVSNHDGAREVSWSPVVAEGASTEEVSGLLARAIESWTGAAARAAVAELVAKMGSPRQALEWFSARAAVALARASTVGGGALAPPSDAPKRRQRPSIDLRAA